MSTATKISGLGSGAALEARAKVMEMTQAAEDSVLRPNETGAFPHDLRAAIAARVARLNGDETLADHYAAHAGAMAPLADPSADGSAQGLAEVLHFVDKVAAQTASVSAGDVDDLRAAGVSDPDIVRLSELNAFLAYQVRLIAGLRLLAGDTA